MIVIDLILPTLNLNFKITKGSFPVALVWLRRRRQRSGNGSGVTGDLFAQVHTQRVEPSQHGEHHDETVEKQDPRKVRHVEGVGVGGLGARGGRVTVRCRFIVDILFVQFRQDSLLLQRHEDFGHGYKTNGPKLSAN
jgi:hypothetical protein